ncbi:DNA ligase 3-like [Amphiura filiformis]|uniref:DNA ligase 3-like n=1 Tax=Amphiura filiformis TaxID=82378 RepID=UPI003B21D758
MPGLQSGAAFVRHDWLACHLLIKRLHLVWQRPLSTQYHHQRVVHNLLQNKAITKPFPTHTSWGFLSCLRVNTCRTVRILSNYQLSSNHSTLFTRHLHTSASDMADNKYAIDYAKLGTSKCKKCKQPIAKKDPRIAKLVSNPFSDDGSLMKQYHHITCMFETFARARATTKKIEDPSDLEGFENMEEPEKKLLRKLMDDVAAKAATKSPGKSPARKKPTTQGKLNTSGPVVSPAKHASPAKASQGAGPSSHTGPSKAPYKTTTDPKHADNSFRAFRKLCASITDEASYLAKTREVSNVLKKGSTGSFQGDTYLLLKLLLPGVVKRVYNINSKQLVKLFSQIFGTDLDAMVTDLEQGDVSETVRKFYEQSQACPPIKKSSLNIIEVDAFLAEMAQHTKELDQQRALAKITARCTANDLKMVVRLIKHDLRINAGAKHILEALDPNAYEAFQASRDLLDVVQRVLENRKASNGQPGMTKKLSVRANLMTPVLPMLAEACKSVGYAMKKCPNGMYAEIKYDGERVQIHKSGDNFQYFSRSLKPVLPHKVAHIKDFIPKACPHGNSLILDSEILMVDKNGKILPFGTLGIHKKSAFQDATVCLFVFDCLHFNGENLMDKTMKERRKILERNLTPIPNRVMFSEMQVITKPEDLSSMIVEVIREGLEGLVLKDVKSVYEPGKRHWLKVKKDYLHEGAMADSADLIVLGAYYGTGNKGGIMSTYLLGVHNPSSDGFLTVTKCSGIDDKTLEKLNTELEVVKINKDMSKVPKWLSVSKNLVPDFVVKDPKKAPVWEIQGAEFTQSETHTAGGISIRFPRVTKFRDDKDWKTATNLQRLKDLFKKSKETSDIANLMAQKTGTSSSPGKSKLNTKLKRNNSGSSDQGSSDSPGGAGPSTGVSPTKKMKKRGSKSCKEGEKRGMEEMEADEVQNGDSPQDSKPVCKYGATCYQTNPQHRSKFSHSASGGTNNKGLANIFNGVSAFVPAKHPAFDKLKRYVIAYNGDVADDFGLDEATHIVVDKHIKEAGQKTQLGKYVTTGWIWECIKQKHLVPETNYVPDC